MIKEEEEKLIYISNIAILIQKEMFSRFLLKVYPTCISKCENQRLVLDILIINITKIQNVFIVSKKYIHLMLKCIGIGKTALKFKAAY